MFFYQKIFFRLISFVLIILIACACSDDFSDKKATPAATEARKQFETALALAEQGDAQHQYLTAECYEKGQGVAQNYQHALNWYKKAAQQRHVQAQFALGSLYKTGRDKTILVDGHRASFWFRRAAMQQYAPAQYELGHLYHYGAQNFEKDIQKAIIWYERAAQNNHIVAQYDLGLLYYLGNEIKQDRKQSLFWLKKAADKNHVQAQWLMGKAYFDKNRDQFDPKEAFFWFEKAAKQNHANAQFELSQMYRQGIGTEKNEDKAKYWMDEAIKNNCIEALAEQGDSFAQYMLGNSYLDGMRPFKEQNNEMAFYWIYQSARRGYLGAQYRLAIMYQHGIGQKKDLNETRYWLDQAVNQFPAVEKAKQGDDFAQLLQGKVYALGTNTYKQNEAQALVWFEQAADNGNAEAQYELALMHLNSAEGKINNDVAQFWLRESAHNGYIPAQRKLKELNQSSM